MLIMKGIRKFTHDIIVQFIKNWLSNTIFFSNEIKFIINLDRKFRWLTLKDVCIIIESDIYHQVTADRGNCW